MNPLDIAEAFRQAILAADPTAAQALCLPGAFDTKGDTAGSLYDQATRKGLDPKPVGFGAVRGDRGAVQVLLYHPQRPTPVGDAWLLVEGGRLGGVTKAKAVAALFLRGELTVRPSFDDLPRSVDGAVWGRKVANQLKHDRDRLDEHLNPARRESGEALRELREKAKQAREVRLGRTVWSRVAQRVGVEIELATEGSDHIDTLWIYLERDGAGGPLVVHSHSRSPSLQRLLEDVELPWGEETDDEGPAMSRDETGDEKLSPEQAQVVVEQAVTEAMKSLGYEPGPDGKPDFSQAKDDPKAKVPEMLLNLFSSVLDQAKAKQAAQGPQDDAPAAEPESAPAAAPPVQVADANVVDLEAERKRREPRPLTPFEAKVQENVKDAFSTYVADNVSPGDTGEVQVDADFLQQHGPALLQAVFQGFTKALVPEEIKVDLPEKSGEGDKKQVKLKVDLGALLQGFASKAKVTPKSDPDKS